MSIIFKPKRTNISGRLPSSLEEGELAVNVADRLLWVADSYNVPRLITGSSAPTSLSALTDVISINPSNNQFLKYINGSWTNVNTEILDGGNF
jgi:hypothetical protein